MRTTLNLDDDVLALAKSFAQARRISLGKAVSFLARKGARGNSRLRTRNGFHMFSVDEQQVKPFGPEDIRKAQEAEDQKYAAYFLPSRRMKP